MKPLLVVVASQLLFTAGDLIARLKMRQYGFEADAFVSWWFAGYMLIRTAATFGELWVLAKLVLGQALPLRPGLARGHGFGHELRSTGAAGVVQSPGR